MQIWNVIQPALMITTFVSVMMLALEYINVQTRGWWFGLLERSRFQAYLIGALLGALPGCLGAFVLVSLYGARRIRVGVVVTGMIATSGDEMFVMLTLVPMTAIGMTLGLMVLGVIAGVLTDWLVPSSVPSDCDSGFEVHGEDRCRCFDLRDWVQTWRRPSVRRLLLVLVAVLAILALTTGVMGPPSWGWERTSLLVVVGFGLFVLLTVPEHFLREHLWDHVARKHAPRIFAWTLGAVAVVHGLDSALDLPVLVANNRWLVLGLAGLVGIVPESGPHLVFVTLYSEGSLPLSVLVASSAVQDGHGMLPLLAVSRLDFLKVKAINLVVGLIAGAALLSLGL